ncbi:MAG: biotin-dependent carboxyltransferase [Eubacterium sp.]|nr:biotin-dependent carboxyltransferase [Eubacterium sp.]
MFGLYKKPVEFEILNQGMMTSIQDPKGRLGYQDLGFPPSGAMDNLALRVGNLLVGNDLDEAGIEFIYVGPFIQFRGEALVAVTGLPCKVRLNGNTVPMWQALYVKKGDVLVIRPENTMGQWGYVSISGGIDVPEYLGSKSTMAICGAGGYKGRVLMKDDVLRTGKIKSLKNAGKRLRGRYVPILSDPMVVELMDGYYMDYLTPDDIELMFTAEWKIQNNSNRVGYRLEGPVFAFSEKAKNKDKEAGSHPSNIFDTGYPLYCINLCGETPVITTPDCVPCGGYFCPFTIPSAAQWKVAQCRIGGKIRFKYTSMEEADHLRESYNAYFKEDHYI